jgi:acetylornithine deacetylase/succinyl-diaminopimelate desuccinylase-like protein
LPVNIKCLFEGEEEIGSPNLKPFIARQRRALACDAVVMSDTRMLGIDRPAITYALRGSLSLELEVVGSPHDLHSGNYGGALHNPLQALCEIISKLHDRDGRVLIPKFYDRVRRWDAAEREYMARVGPKDAEILRNAGVARGWGEVGYTLYERTTIRPAVNVTGLTGGHQGTGGKSIVPARASAKIDIRLVPDQEPEEIERLFRAHICRLTPSTARSFIHTFFRTSPALVNRRHPAMRAAFAAYRGGFGVPPVFVRSGGSIPVVNEFQEQLGAPTILMGFALPDDRIHAPNEKFHLPNFFKGIETCICFLREVASRPELRRAREQAELQTIAG